MPSSQRSPTRHLKRGIDGVFEIVRVVGRGLVSIAEVHAIISRAHLAQSEPEMAGNRFGLLERHATSSLIVGWPVCRFAPVRDLLLCAKHLFAAARPMRCSHHAAAIASSRR